MKLPHSSQRFRILPGARAPPGMPHHDPDHFPQTLVNEETCVVHVSSFSLTPQIIH